MNSLNLAISNKREQFTDQLAVRLQNVQLEYAAALYIIQSSYPSDLLASYTAKNGWHSQPIEQAVSVNNVFQNRKKHFSALNSRDKLSGSCVFFRSLTAVDFITNLFKKHAGSSFKKELTNILGFSPKNLSLYKTALTHRSVRDAADENNERLEYLGDAVLSALVADYLFKRYPYKEEGFLTEMRSKMVNRQQLNDIAVRMGLKKITLYNKLDSSLKASQIFGNTLESMVGAVYLDLGYKKTAKWVQQYILLPHMFMDDLENLEINHKNKLYGWANKNGKVLEFETIKEQLENGRRLFTVAAVIDGKTIAQGKAFNKKDASQIAAQAAVEKLGIINADTQVTENKADKMA